MDAVERYSVRAYSGSRLRFLFAMVARWAFQMVNSSASHIIVRPMVVMAARALGPGPTRLRLVKLAHNLSHTATVVELPRAEHDAASSGQPVQPTRRAA
ncbi:MAG TPA: hypothetical protein VKE27_08350 [Candidatus Dormibacteraeota bacterium]|nr:hypothetical protein [Candidatus Dormibacteraeota bacterium]